MAQTDQPLLVALNDQLGRLPEPDFLLDGGGLSCYYSETVLRLLAAERERLIRPVGWPVEKREEDGGLSALVMACAFAIRVGQRTVTITASGKRPAGFPRGELLSVGKNGQRNYAVCPVKMLGWLQARTSKPPNEKVRR